MGLNLPFTIDIDNYRFFNSILPLDIVELDRWCNDYIGPIDIDGRRWGWQYYSAFVRFEFEHNLDTVLFTMVWL